MKYTLLIASALFLASCGNTADKETGHEGHDHDHNGASHSDAHATTTTTTSTTAEGPKDPVCKMTKTADWTDYSVNKTNNSDTTWFCSPVCKEQFDANPTKFEVKS